MLFPHAVGFCLPYSGDIAFRHMVQKYKERFRLGSRKAKIKIIDEVLAEWHMQEPPGRFVNKKINEVTGEREWYVVGHDLARKRAAKSLAHWTQENKNVDDAALINDKATTSTIGSTERKRSTASFPLGKQVA